MLALDDVRLDLGEKPVLRGLSLDFPAGQTTALIGPSGCGKSTVLRLLVGLLRPDAGVVRFDGEPLTPGRMAAARHRTGYVIQEGGLFPHLSAGANATLLARELKRPAAEIAARLDELARLVRLGTDLLDRPPGRLSGGERQRVALMRALFLDPDVLLLDEPLGALDPMVRAGLQDDLREILDGSGKTVVLVTHDLAEAAHFSERLVLMRAGEAVQAGRLEDLRERPADGFVRGFLAAQRR
ncbi:ATP-binding cassette domain-containing protein [Phycisphaera mikurensis]|uniref:Putative ABC transporter ATP-binding protein n=1 Tax=Phycisphaera mikurensis (strain NBRC 102666 / KCTC 22515 / FYK2301M01) TaxID=1142394 RepID=I0IG45_PHYMF|nr:ATP-binding cassette domain-containing protein [Phycisphaera mikurensis]MBB6440385.1 osmoprotectant transport system ATP-binding protein [Phycisphaera mikurensis]BAM04233.1 putative ABC transporter ATP-binding protein [Phycisphaera mikurensis NBRC 102666]